MIISNLPGGSRSREVAGSSDLAFVDSLSGPRQHIRFVPGLLTLQVTGLVQSSSGKDDRANSVLLAMASEVDEWSCDDPLVKSDGEQLNWLSSGQRLTAALILADSGIAKADGARAIARRISRGLRHYGFHISYATEASETERQLVEARLLPEDSAGSDLVLTP